MGKEFIVLSGMLLAKARLRAAEKGFAGVGEYVAELVRQDTGVTIRIPAAIPRTKGKGSKRQQGTSAIRKRLLDGMISYMKASEDPGYGYACGYTLKHIERCAAITQDFLKRLSATPRGDAAKILAEVKRVVSRLNQLNGSCGGALIETDQREELCLLIQTAANNAGLTAEEDVTTPWREW